MPARRPSAAAPSRRRPDRRGAPWRGALTRVLVVLAVAAAAVAVAAWWKAQRLVDEFQAGPKRPVVQAVVPELDVEPADPAPGLDDAMTVLAVGSDNRPWEKSGRSDTMLLVRVIPDGPSVSVLSLPRDLRVTVPGHGARKLNDAYTIGGAALLTRTIREYLGVKINHYVQVDFKGFGKVVSGVGGVYLPIDQRYLHVNDGTPLNNWGSIDLRPGYQRLGREDALSWVRFRHLDSDFHRAARQQLFLREVGRQLQGAKSSPTRLPGLLETMAEATTSDLDGLGETVQLANTLRKVPPDRISRVTMQADDVTLGGVFYLQASPAQRRAALRAWAHPGRRIAQQRSTHLKLSRPGRRSARSALRSDGGAGAQLAARLHGPDVCSPSALPDGFSWPAAADATHSYTIDGRPAAALYATKSSGVSVLWMFARWEDPPVLRSPSQVRRYGGRTVEFFYESGRLRTVAWRQGTSRAWITNTLRNELSSAQMVALARTCR